MHDTLYDHHHTLSIGGRRLSNRLADDIHLMAGVNNQLQILTDKLTASAYGRKIARTSSKSR